METRRPTQPPNRQPVTAMRRHSPPNDSPDLRILVRGVNWLGDAVMTTPALLRLREAYPQSHITLLTHLKLASLWEHHPAINEILTFNQNSSLRQIAQNLRPHQFHIGLALPNSHRSALELWLASIPHRIGFSAPARSWFLTQALRHPPHYVRMRKRTPKEARKRYLANQPPDPLPPPSAHQIHLYLHLTAALGAKADPLPPQLHVTPKEILQARATFNVPENQRWIGLNAGAEYGPAKRWPLDRFAQTAALTQQKTGCHLLILGGPADLNLAQDLHQQIRHLNPNLPPPVTATGKTSLRQLCALLKCCHALLTNDSGPMHVAAALNVPVITPFGSTSPELTGPGLPGDPKHHILRQRTPCNPCFLRHCPVNLPCMTQITVESAVHALLQSLTPDP
ncbi:MAG: hypothetical protein RI897_4413 [Verrucomicrobiota bacterium]